MKKILFPLLALLTVACSPQVYSLYLDVRQPCLSGLDLARKTMAVVTMEQEDSLFDRNCASAFAKVLDTDYFGGQEVVELYTVPAADSVSLDMMHTLVMDTEADVIFVLSNTLGVPDEVEQKIPLNTSLGVYDSMGEDTVHRFRGHTSFLPEEYEEGFPKMAEKVGQRIGNRFVSQWKTESFGLYYFDNIQVGQWEKGLSYAYKGEYAKAIDVWTGLLNSGNEISKAAACYNIAMAMYLLEDPYMASRWLDKADSLENLSLSPGLRKRIQARLEK